MGARVASRKMRRVHERNAMFDTAGNELKRRGELLRIRTESLRESRGTRRGSAAERVTLTFKRPTRAMRLAVAKRAEKYKVREEIEAEVTDGRGLVEVLTGMGMRVWFRYEKYRTTFRLAKSQRWARGLLIELDETPMGLFAELEGPRRAIDRAAKLLGYRERDYITENYFVLYRDYCRRKRKKLGDMLFARNKP